MPVTEQVQEVVKGTSRNTALTAAAAAAATGAATYAVRRARAHNGSGVLQRSGSSSILASAAESGWEAAADVLIPMAEGAAESAGRYVAQHGPEAFRERIIPKFIEAFNDAKWCLTPSRGQTLFGPKASARPFPRRDGSGRRLARRMGRVGIEPQHSVWAEGKRQRVLVLEPAPLRVQRGVGVLSQARP